MQLLKRLTLSLLGKCLSEVALDERVTEKRSSLSRDDIIVTFANTYYLLILYQKHTLFLYEIKKAQIFFYTYVS